MTQRKEDPLNESAINRQVIATKGGTCVHLGMEFSDRDEMIVREMIEIEAKEAALSQRKGTAVS